MPSPPEPSPARGAVPRRRRGGLRALLAAWAVATVAVGAALAALHLPLSGPAHDRLEGAFAAERRPAEAGAWTLVHVLYDRCRCSRRVAEHLASRPRIEGTAERVLLVGGEAADVGAGSGEGGWGGDGGGLASRLRGAGLPVAVLSRAELAARYGIEAAPLLVIVSPGGRVAYAGGYSAREGAADIRDVELAAAARAGAGARPLPLFGCAVSRTLQRDVDPLGLKY
jgi:hypothetical protein